MAERTAAVCGANSGAFYILHSGPHPQSVMSPGVFWATAGGGDTSKRHRGCSTSYIRTQPASHLNASLIVRVVCWYTTFKDQSRRPFNRNWDEREIIGERHSVFETGWQGFFTPISRYRVTCCDGLCYEYWLVFCRASVDLYLEVINVL